METPIVPASPNSVRTKPEAESWSAELRTAVRDARQLGRRLGLSGPWVEAAERASRQFPVFVPEPYLRRIRPGDPSDPLLRQVLPLENELHEVAGFEDDPVGDRQATLEPGLLRKYRGRALLVTTGACAVHCRYCFRRHYPYDEGPRSPDQWTGVLERIAADPTLDEVLLSGGDPLMLTDRVLSELARRLAAIPHLKRLRVHTRLPIMIPSRVTAELLDWLTGSRLQAWVVVHANHAAELDRSVADALGRMLEAGIPVLNQAVLLRGVNDSLEALEALCQRLIDLRVLPYYLHQLDRVRGAAHFEVPIPRGRELIAALRDRLPGYAVPRYVQEIAGTGAKQPLA